MEAFLIALNSIATMIIGHDSRVVKRYNYISKTYEMVTVLNISVVGTYFTCNLCGHLRDAHANSVAKHFDLHRKIEAYVQHIAPNTASSWIVRIDSDDLECNCGADFSSFEEWTAHFDARHLTDAPSKIPARGMHNILVELDQCADIWNRVQTLRSLPILPLGLRDDNSPVSFLDADLFHSIAQLALT